MTERRFELRYSDDGREVTGTAIKYGDVATLPWGRERFEPGAFGDLGGADVILNVQHDRQNPLCRTDGGGLFLSDDGGELSIKADLPETTAGNDTLTQVRGRVLRGLSIEFIPTKHRFEGDVQVIEAAVLDSISIVDRPAYPESTIQARMQARPQARQNLFI